MAVLPRRIWVIGSITVLLVLSALVGIYQVWAGLGLKRHPWHLEAHLESSMAASRSDPNAYVFGRELIHLAAQANEASRCSGL